MNRTYLFKTNLRVAVEFPSADVDFLVENDYAEFYRTITIGGEEVDYYRPKQGCTYDCSYCNPDEE
jgi:hypothetical protein